MASIVISPASDSFGASGGSGTLTVTVETANWHTEPRSGDIWMAVRKRTGTTWGSWQVFRIVGEKGADGVSPAYPYRKDYDSGAVYYGNPVRTDIVRYNGAYWKAKYDNPDSDTGYFSGQAPYEGSPYWDSFGGSFESIATGLAFAVRAIIENAVVRYLQTAETGKRIEVDNNQLQMFDSNNKVKLLITGDDLGDIAESEASVSFQSHSASGTGGSVSTVKTLASFQTSAADTTVTLPELEVSVARGGGQGSLKQEFVEASAAYILDGEEVSNASLDGVIMYPADLDRTFMIPSKQIPVTSGSHVLQIRMDAMMELSNTVYISIESGSVLLSTDAAKMKIGGNGSRTAFSATEFSEFIRKSDGNVYLTLRVGSYGFRVGPSGIQKLSNGSWVAASL